MSNSKNLRSKTLISFFVKFNLIKVFHFSDMFCRVLPVFVWFTSKRHLSLLSFTR